MAEIQAKTKHFTALISHVLGKFIFGYFRAVTSCENALLLVLRNVKQVTACKSIALFTKLIQNGMHIINSRGTSVAVLASTAL